MKQTTYSNFRSPVSEVAAVAHIYQDAKKNVYNAILNMADVQDGKNSFYKLQLLEHDKKKKLVNV